MTAPISNNFCRVPGKAFNKTPKNYRNNAVGIKEAVLNTINMMNTNCEKGLERIGGKVKIEVLTNNKTHKAHLSVDTKGLKGPDQDKKAFVDSFQAIFDQFKFNGTSYNKVTLDLSI